MFSFASQKMASGEAAVQPIMTSNGSACHGSCYSTSESFHFGSPFSVARMLSFVPPSQLPRHAPPSLSLGSFACVLSHQWIIK